MAGNKRIIETLLRKRRIPGKVYYSQHWQSWMFDLQEDNDAPQRMGNIVQAIEMVTDGTLDFCRGFKKT